MKLKSCKIGRLIGERDVQFQNIEIHQELMGS